MARTSRVTSTVHARKGRLTYPDAGGVGSGILGNAFGNPCLFFGQSHSSLSFVRCST